jgi:hypothetical protein
MLTFEEYLAQKNIDQEKFRQAEPARYKEWITLFGQINQESFTNQKKFLINDVRRRYTLKDPNAPDRGES